MTAAKIRALIADDESAARRGLRLLLERDPEVTVVAEVASGSEAVKRIVAEKPDLVFLDVQMPELDGFKVLQAVNGSHAPVIIFVTAFDEHALKAFEVNAVDYLLKPYDDERFFAALRRAKAEGLAVTREASPQHLTLTHDAPVRVIQKAERGKAQ